MIQGLSIHKEIFTNESFQRLNSHSYKTKYLRLFSQDEINLYQGFQLLWLWDSEQLVGYALIDDVLGGFFYELDDHQEIMEVAQIDQTYSYLAFFEIFEKEQDKGYGTLFIELLKEQYQEHPIVIYTTEDSVGFWLNKGFTEANQSDWWLMSCIRKEGNEMTI
jgi:GNAT superfamily N-acetyltransferase